jgi:hypothetical protein
VRADHVVQAGEEAHHKEQGGGHRHGPFVCLHNGIVAETGRTDISDWNGQEEFLRKGLNTGERLHNPE